MAQIEIASGHIVLVDDEDVSIMLESKWRYKPANRGKHYVVRGAHKYGKQYREGALHRIIMQPGDGDHVDHVNGDTLDNRRCNLRVVTRSQNMQNANKKTPDKCYSPFKGAFFDKRRGSWYSMICIDRKSKYLGRAASQFEAAFIYDLASLEHFKGFGRRNFLPLVV